MRSLFLSCLLAIALGGVAGEAFAKQNVPLSHGRYCGVGHSDKGAQPVDALDEACMEHDQCWDAGKPTCGCHQAFVTRIKEISEDPETREVIKALAKNMIFAITKAPCQER